MVALLTQDGRRVGLLCARHRQTDKEMRQSKKREREENEKENEYLRVHRSIQKFRRLVAGVQSETLSMRVIIDFPFFFGVGLGVCISCELNSSTNPPPLLFPSLP